MGRLRKHALLPREYLMECLEYVPETGLFIWKNRQIEHFKRKRTFVRWLSVQAGREAGYVGTSGYVHIRLLGKVFLAHRLAWLFVVGEWPASEVDHLNHIKTDNRWTNLRSVTRQENAKNRKLPSANKSGAAGVIWHRNKWYAQIKVNRKMRHIGVFADKADAITARKEAEKMYGFHENHGLLD